MFLEPDELATLTGKVQPGAQSKALSMMGIEHRRRPDGKVIVLRSALEPELKPSKAVEPAFENVT